MELQDQLEQLHPESFAWALACCDRNREDAEEILQTVYVKVLEGKARFDGRSALKTWLFAVIRNTAMTHRRTRWRRLGFLRNLVRRDVADDIADDDAERDLVRAERTAQLRAALQKLARRQREMMELVFYHDMTIEAAGATLGISLGTARVHYERAKKNLLTLLS